jgi:hypothetical protein
MFDLYFMCERCLSIPVTDKLGHAFPFDLQWIAPVHDLNQQCTSSMSDLVIIFFHGIGLGKNDQWKETLTSITSDGKCVCWPQESLPADLASKNGNNVRILSLSYDSALLGANENVTDIGKNLIQSLVCKRYANLILNVLCTNTY